MDTLLGRFLEQEYDKLDAAQQALFERFLDEADPDIYSWVLGYASPDNPGYQFLVSRLQNIHVTNK